MLLRLSPSGVRPGEKRQAVLVVLVMAGMPPVVNREVAKAALLLQERRMTKLASYEKQDFSYSEIGKSQ